MSEFKDVLLKRRSIYALGKNSELSTDEIVARLREVQQTVPTANNSQTTRLVVLTGEANTKLWNLIYDVPKEVLNEAMWNFMSPIMVGAKEAMGTVLFFEDRDAENPMSAKGECAEAYKQNNNANSQFAIWLALAEMNLGASLQHFNIGYEQGFDKAIREMFNLPASYELIAQMPFGSVEQPAGEKENIDPTVQVQIISG